VDKQGKMDSLLRSFNHRSARSKVVTPPRLAAAAARLLARGGCDRRALLGEMGALIVEDNRQERLTRYPRYVPLETSVDAAQTAAEDDDAGMRREHSTLEGPGGRDGSPSRPPPSS